MRAIYHPADQHTWPTEVPDALNMSFTLVCEACGAERTLERYFNDDGVLCIKALGKPPAEVCAAEPRGVDL